MLLSPSADRAKSWICEHCRNWGDKNIEYCLKCFWTHPENYEHIAGDKQRAINVLSSGKGIDDYKKLINLVGKDNAQTFIKYLIHNYLDKN